MATTINKHTKDGQAQTNEYRSAECKNEAITPLTHKTILGYSSLFVWLYVFDTGEHYILLNWKNIII